MDELEISGKRYISTRRAAKENKYHSDYIGQLIRAGKVEGQKVGRSWYVVANSLGEYLGKEGSVKAPTITRTQTSAETIKEEKEVIIEVPQRTEPEEEPEIQSEIIEEKIEDEDEHHIPVKISAPEIKKEMPVIKTTRSSLRYLSDDGPLYPRVEAQARSKINIRPIERPIENVVEETIYIEEEPIVIIEKPRRTKKSIRSLAVRGGVVVVAGVVTLGVVVAASAFVISTTTVQEGVVSVSYSLSRI